MNADALSRILASHRRWLETSGAEGVRADLRGADLSRANLSDADLRGADLSGASHVIPLGNPNGFFALAWINDGVMRVRVGCRDKTIGEARAYWSRKPDRREVLAALDYADAVRAIRAESDPYWFGK